MNTLLDHALGYRRRGMSVIPTSGKDPIEVTPGHELAWGRFRRRPPSESQLRGWFDDFDPTGIACLCCRGLVVRDYDDPESYHRWAICSDGLDQELPTVQTPHGFHVYFCNGCTHIVLQGDGELRGDGYVVSPPTPGYSWVIPLPDGPLAQSLPELDPVACGLAERAAPQRIHTHDIKGAVLLFSSSLLSCVCIPSRDADALAATLAGTLPTRPGTRNRRLFDLARALMPFFMDPKDARPVVELWHREALPNIRTKAFGVTWRDFLHSWAGAKYARGSANRIVARALALVEASDPPAAAAGYDPLTAGLVHLCWAFQVESGVSAFFLSCRLAARLLEVANHWDAWNALNRLKDDRIIVQTRDGTIGPKGDAAWFRYINPEEAT